MNIKTMAQKITRKNYSLAVALLPNEIAGLPPGEVIGGYMLINVPGAQRGINEPVGLRYGSRAYRGRQATTLGMSNTWLREVEFNILWKFISKAGAESNDFAEVEMKPRPKPSRVRHNRFREEDDQEVLYITGE